MLAVVVKQPGDETQLGLAQIPEPQPGPEELLLRVRATAINRADLHQRQGNYPPPKGAPQTLGLECAGEVLAMGAAVRGWQVGERAMALLPGGGYAQQAVVHFGSAMHVPAALSDAQAAAIPEVFLTAFLNLFMLGGIASGHSALIHGGGSGVGTAAIQLLRDSGVRVFITAGSREKCERGLRLGADVAINYQDGPFAPKVLEATSGRGVDAVLDSIGAAYLAQNLEVLALEGRLLLIGTLKGAKADLDLGQVMRKRLRIIGSTLRARAASEKAEIVAAFWSRFGAALSDGRIVAQIDCVMPLEQVAEAHRRMRASLHFGKIVLQVP